MKTSIVFSSTTGNTQKLAETIQGKINADYCGKIEDSALESDMLYVGFWTKGFSCDDATAEFLKKLKNKKVFLFGTAGYDNTPEYFEKVLTAAKTNLDSSNELVGEFMSMGKVSAPKQKAIKDMDEAKYNGMKAKLDEAESHPSQSDLDSLVAKLG